MQRNLKGAQQRAIQYWFVDGLAELGAGMVCLLFAGLFWLQDSLSQTPLSIAAAFAGACAIRWVMLRVKAHSTYPRTGYVKPAGWRTNPTSTVIAVLLSVLMVMCVMGIGVFGLVLNLRLEADGQQMVAWMPLMAGAMFAFIFIWIGQQLALTRLSALGLVSLLLGGILTISRLSDLHASAVLCALVGLALLAFGLRTRRAYLRLHQHLEANSQ